jgi:DNA-binding transcriptional LysR family regulator
VNWQHINGFYHVLKLGSFSKAAHATGRTQSAVSHQIQSLEAYLGCQLLNRNGREVSATQAGDELYKFAVLMISEQSAVLQRLNAMKSQRPQRLVISATGDSLSKVLPEFIKQFLQTNPDVNVKLLQNNYDDIIAGVRDGHVDLGFGRIDSIPSDVQVRSWLSLEHFLVAPSSHPVWDDREITLGTIASHPLIVPPSSDYAQTTTVLLNALRSAGHSAEIALECPDVDRSVAYARLNIGVYFALCTPQMLQGLPDDMRCESIRHLFSDKPYGAFFSELRSLSNPAKLFLATVGLDT